MHISTKNLSEKLTYRPALTQHLDIDECVEAFVTYLESDDYQPCELDGFDPANDMAVGLYWYFELHHTGQWCPMYAWRCRIPYQPGMGETGPDESCEEFYNALLEMNYE